MGKGISFFVPAFGRVPSPRWSIDSGHVLDRGNPGTSSVSSAALGPSYRVSFGSSNNDSSCQSANSKIWILDNEMPVKGQTIEMPVKGQTIVMPVKRQTIEMRVKGQTAILINNHASSLKTKSILNVYKSSGNLKFTSYELARLGPLYLLLG